MAIDTEAKRRSTMGIWGVCRVLPVPVAGISTLDRISLWIYGAAVSAGSGDPATPGIGAWNSYQQFIIVGMPTHFFPRT